MNVTLSYTGMNKLSSFIKVHKNRLPNLPRWNVVYKISCLNCDASYVGQTGRLLGTRVKEHHNHIKRNSTQHSVITDHRLMNHDFNWNDIDILDKEPILNKRLLSEMLYIKRQNNSLNLKTDTDCLQHKYVMILEKLTRV